MKKALPNPTGPSFQLTQEILQRGYQESQTSPRLRIIYPVQRSQNAEVQRLINFLQPGTYIQPHCHPEPHATESLAWISGHLELLLFSDKGEIQHRLTLNQQHPLLDIEPGTWHGMIIKEKDTAIFEVKKGPYDPSADKHFASWAPPEGQNECDTYLQSLA